MKISQEELNNIPKITVVKMYMQLSDAFDKLSNQLEVMEQQNKELLLLTKDLKEKVNILTTARYGRKTERLSEITDDQIRMDLGDMFNVFNEAEALCETGISDEPQIEEITYKRKKKKGKRDEDLSALEVVVEPTIELSEEKLTELFPYGYNRLPDEVYRDLEYIPQVLKVHEHHIAVYAGKRDTGIVKANKPERLLKNSVLSTSLAAGIIDLKYVNHLPLNRISEDLARKDVIISRQVLAGWMVKIPDRYFRPVYRKLHKEMLKAKLIHCDETPFTLIHNGRAGHGKDYMWVFHTGPAYNSPPIYIYKHDSNGNRSSDVPRNFLKDFKGYMLTDGYQVYHSIANTRPDELKVAGCWAHARRRFADIVKAGGKKASKGTIAEEAATRISAIYHVDNMKKDAANAERLEHRQIAVKPLVDSYFNWLKELKEMAIDKSSETMKAMNYSLNQEVYLRAFLEDGMIPLDNNAAERTVKNFCVGKHSWHVIDSKNGAESSAILYSIAETAKLNGLKTFEYFKYLLDKILEHQDDAPEEYIDDIMPWSDKLPKELLRVK